MIYPILKLTLLIMWMALVQIKLTNGKEYVHCVFIHGAGTKRKPDFMPISYHTPATIDKLPEDIKTYWGDVASWAQTPTTSENPRAPCTSYAFAYLDTVNTPWSDKSLARAACEALDHTKTETSQTYEEVKNKGCHCLGQTNYDGYENTCENHEEDDLPYCYVDKESCVSAEIEVKKSKSKKFNTDKIWISEEICTLQEENDQLLLSKQSTRVFLHSMGNLIFFNALKIRQCEVDEKNTKIYSFGGPILGSNILDLALEACQIKAGYKVIEKDESFVGTTFRYLTTIFGILVDNDLFFMFAKNKINDTIESEEFQEQVSSICEKDTGKLTESFESLRLLNKKPDEEILSIAKKHTTGAICGYNIGDTFLYQFVKNILNKNHKSENHDGVVEIKSCKAVNPDADWSYDDNSDFFLSALDHNSIIGRGGNPRILKKLEKLG